MSVLVENQLYLRVSSFAKLHKLLLKPCHAPVCGETQNGVVVRLQHGEDEIVCDDVTAEVHSK